MMNNVSHQAHWQYIPYAAPRLTRWQRFCRWLDRLFEPMMALEARDRIDPDAPYGHWAKGWQRPALPIKYPAR